jgi:hypothetical protein
MTASNMGDGRAIGEDNDFHPLISFVFAVIGGVHDEEELTVVISLFYMFRTKNQVKMETEVKRRRITRCII